MSNKDPHHFVHPNDFIHNTLTKREYFTSMAMQGVLASRELQQALNADRQRWEDFAVEVADNLIKSLNKESNNA